MARQFNGTNQSLQSASAIDLTAFNKVGVSFWLWWDVNGSDNDLALEFGNGSIGGFFVDPNESASNFEALIFGTVGNGILLATQPTAATWHHIAVNYDFSAGANLEIEGIYIDNVSVGGSPSGPNNSDNFGNLTLNVMSRNNTSLFGAGRMAELALYGGHLLTAGERTSLQTTKPNLVGSPTHGWHLDGTASPEPNFVGGVDLTVNGATFVDHPPVFASTTPGSGMSPSLYRIRLRAW